MFLIISFIIFLVIVLVIMLSELFIVSKRGRSKLERQKKVLNRDYTENEEESLWFDFKALKRILHLEILLL